MPANQSPVECSEDKPWALKTLPPFPPIALQLLSLLDNPDVPLKKIVELLRADPAISAELLRVANSALYGFVQQIESVQHAVVVLGRENVKRLALTVALGRLARGSLRHENLRVCWNHVVASAMIAEQLAVWLNTEKDRAHTAALLHDVGRLALLVCYPVEYGNLLAVAQDEQFDPLECERQLFDIDHCAAGCWLARHWNLPPDFASAIAQHHTTGALSGGHRSLAALVRCACRLADCLGYSVLQTAPAQSTEEILRELPLGDTARAQADLEVVHERIDKALQTIGAPGVPPDPTPTA